MRSLFRMTLFCFIAIMDVRAGGVPDGEAVIRLVEATNSWVEDYTANLTVSVDMERLRVPQMHVKIYFKQPDKFHFDSQGFAILPRQLTGMNFARLRERYTIDPRVVTDTIDGVRGLVVTLSPRDDRTLLKHIRMLVDSTLWQPVRLRMPLLDGRLLTASLKYIAVNNHWMPGQLLVTFVTAANDSTVPNLTDQMGPVRRPQLPHEGSVRLMYSDYAVNTGLGDDLFKEPEREQKRK